MMKNKITDVFKVAGRLVVVVVANPDFTDLRVGKTVRIGDKEYVIHSAPVFDCNPPKFLFERDTFVIDYTDDELLHKQAIFKN